MFKKIIILSLVFFGLSGMVIGNILTDEGGNMVQQGELESGYPPIVVLELFTSQGCSSCPPADALLQKVNEQYQGLVFALSYHVDYWNYIGWKDPFSKAVYTKKQSEYNRKFGYRGNYTPELVFNGREHFVGSNGAKLYSKIENHESKGAANGIVLSKVIANDGKVDFQYVMKGSLAEKQLRAVLVLDEKTTQVARGENRNRTLRNTNVVVAENYIPLSKELGTSSISIPEIAKGEKVTLMVLVEHDNLDILAAAKTSVR